MVIKRFECWSWAVSFLQGSRKELKQLFGERKNEVLTEVLDMLYCLLHTI